MHVKEAIVMVRMLKFHTKVLKLEPMHVSKRDCV
jgi:hypothetical protein